MRLPALACLLALALPAAAAAAPAAADKPADFASGLPLTLAANQPFHRVELPLAVHAQARPDLADVRVFNAAGEAVPYAFTSNAAPAIASAPVPVPRFPLRVADSSGASALAVRIEADGRLIALSRTATATTPAAWLLDLSALREPVIALQLDWAAPADGFSAQAHVEGSDDLDHWTMLGQGPLVDLQYGGQRLQQKRIPLPATRFRYLRLTASTGLPVLAAAAAEPLPAAAAMPERWLDIPGHADAAAGTYVFDLGAHLVASRVQLRLPQANAVAPVEWQVRALQRDEWRSVARTTTYRLQRDGGEVISPPLEVGRQPGRYWRLRVDPRAGGLGAGTPVLHLAWTPTELVFLARGTPPFTLAFGDRDAHAVQLPLASLLPGYRAGMEASLPLALPGAPHALGGHNAPPAGHEDQPPPDWKRWLLWGILLAGVGLLALMAHALLRKGTGPA